MPPLFRKRQSAATLPADETITDDLLAAIPDVGAKVVETPVPFVDVTPVDDDAPIALPESWNPAEILARRAMREESARQQEDAAREEKNATREEPAPERKADREEKAPDRKADREEKAKGAAREEPKARPAEAPAAKPPALPDVAALVLDVRRQMETVFTRELGKVEDTFGTSLRDMEARLQRATAEIEDLRRENESLLRMKAEYDRKAEALRELARSFKADRADS